MSETPKSGVSKWVGGIVVLVLAYFGYDQLGGNNAGGATAGSPPTEQSAPAERGGTETAQPPTAAENRAPLAETAKPAEQPKVQPPKVQPPKPTVTTLMVRGPSGRSIDIFPTIDRIQKGIKHPHRNDGSVFQNRERLLPRKSRGYYREYVHPTPGQRGPGAQRVIIGDQGEIYYTPDHYESFQRVAHTFKKDDQKGNR